MGFGVPIVGFLRIETSEASMSVAFEIGMLCGCKRLLKGFGSFHQIQGQMWLSIQHFSKQPPRPRSSVQQ